MENPQETHSNGAAPVQEGWLCPRCGKINSPDVAQCPCSPKPEAQGDGTVGLVEGR